MYGRLNSNGQLEYFTAKCLRVNGRTYSNPLSQVLMSVGYLPVAEVPNGKVAKSWRVSDDGDSICPVLADKEVRVLPRKFSKLKLICQLKDRGLYQSFVDLVDSAGLTDEWVAAQDLKDDNSLFMQYADQIRQAMGVSEVELEEILSSSIYDERD